MSRPRKITDEKMPRLIEVARTRLKAEALLAGMPVNKQLAYEIGVSPKYLHNVMHRLTKILRTKPDVPRETLRRALMNDNEFTLLMDRLLARVDQRLVRIRREEAGNDLPSA